jgi:hypothetical protein
MSIFETKTKNLLKSFNDFFKINPHKHWVFLLYVFFTLISISLLFSFYFIYEIKNEKIFQAKAEQEAEQSLLKVDLLKKTTDLFNKKDLKQQEINNNLSPYRDPSL